MDIGTALAPIVTDAMAYVTGLLQDFGPLLTIVVALGVFGAVWRIVRS